MSLNFDRATHPQCVIWPVQMFVSGFLRVVLESSGLETTKTTFCFGRTACGEIVLATIQTFDPGFWSPILEAMDGPEPDPALK